LQTPNIGCWLNYSPEVPAFGEKSRWMADVSARGAPTVSSSAGLEQGRRMPQRPQRSISRFLVALALVIAAATVGAFMADLVAPPVAKDVSVPSSLSVKAGSASAALATLATKGRAPKTGYDRTLFGQPWADVDRNGCDTRNDVLRRDLTAYVLKARTHGCLVLSGTLNDPYTGMTIAFVRGQATSAKVQIDHVVALSDAWQKGAQQWPAETRRTFANDSLNLLAVDGPANMAKGDGDAATWLPPAKGYRCAYVARQVAVKARYHLWMAAAERDAVARVLAACPGQVLPTWPPAPLER
jgi:hypothetical protein